MAVRRRDDEEEEDGGGGGRRERRRGRASGEGQSFTWETLTIAFEELMYELGELGFQRIEEVGSVLDGVRGTFGPAGTTVGLTLLAALTSNSQVAARIVRAFGLPPQAEELLNEGVKDFFQGLRVAHANGGKMSPRSRAALIVSAKKKMKEAAQKLSFDQVLRSFDPHEQAAFGIAYEQLSDADRELFDRYKKARLLSDPLIVLVLLELPYTQWIAHLKLRFGDPPAAAGGVGAIGGAISGAAKKMDGRLRAFLNPPAGQPNRVLDGLRDLERKLGRRGRIR